LVKVVFGESPQVSEHTTVIIGAGPAGLAAGYELASNGRHVVVIEKDSVVGGISRTISRNGFRFDVGGHRFFTKFARVQGLWQQVLPEQFLQRKRLSRIYYNGRFFDYPLRLGNVLWGLGFFTSAAVAASFLAGKLRPYPQEDTLEQWVSNRFGKKLFEIFFKGYTEKVWGIDCSQIRAEWAAQRIRGLSLASAVKTALIGDRDQKIRTLIQQFDYPRLGPGQVYETMAEKVRQMGGQVLLQHRADKLLTEQDRVVAVEVVAAGGARKTIPAVEVLSSMPIDELAAALSPPAPANVLGAAGGLSYRSLLTVNLMMRCRQKLPDTWVYIHSPQIRAGRVQFFSNWSPYMVPDENCSSLGLEYFCTEGDELWGSPDQQLIELGIGEAVRLRMVQREAVFDAFVVRMPRTYPVYSIDSGRHLETIKGHLSGLKNLQCIGRNGMFKYNNMDHSILSGLWAADNIRLQAGLDLWSINTEQQYYEQAQGS
jgi:protoporphyrinogen oxidase